MTSRAAVIVSGGGSISPFTSPTAACASGLAAGGTDTALRAALLDAGIATFTAPVSIGGGPVQADPGRHGFADPPAVLPADMTVDSQGDVEESAACLARFLLHLHEEFGVRDVDIVAHSLGAIISRSAHMQMRASNPPVAMISLTSIGTGWLGSFVRHFDRDTMPMPEPAASYALAIMDHMRQGGRLVAEGNAPPLWSAGKEHGLDGLALTRIAGTYFTGDGEEQSPGSPYPHDGMVTDTSALATGADPIVFPEAACFSLPDVHSIYFAGVMDLEWERSITWDPRVMELVVAAIGRA